jgi:16S rRNA (guanine527-N7)-methyltransferase
MDVNCVDTVAKKAAFIQQAAVSLKLPNLKGIHARVESLKTVRHRQLPGLRLADRLHHLVACRHRAARHLVRHEGQEARRRDGALGADVQVFHVEHCRFPAWMRSAASSGCAPLAERAGSVVAVGSCTASCGRINSAL